MADSSLIDTLIAEHQQTLQLTWLTHTRPGISCVTPAMQYWIGEYAPDQHHAIELIHRDNLPQFTQALQQACLYLPERLVAAQPDLIIFSEGLTCDNETLDQLQRQGIAALHSPLPTKTILRELAYNLAEHDTNQTVHGVMLSICDEGVLLTGKSRIGKSALALELVSRGHRLVTDDAPLLHRFANSEQVYAICPPLLADFLEVYAAGILHLGKLFGPKATCAMMPLQLVIELVESFTPEPEQRLRVFNHRTNILGVDIPYLQIPVRYPANLALIVETVTKNHVLYKDGYDASDNLIKRQQQLLNKQTV